MDTYIYRVSGSLQVFQDVEAPELSVEIILDEVIPAVLAGVSRLYGDSGKVPYQ